MTSLILRLRHWLPAAAAIALSLFIAVFVWGTRQDRYHNDLAVDFSFEARELSTRLQDRMTAYRQILRGARAVASSLGVPSKADWDNYITNLYLNIDFAGIQAIGYANRVSAAGLDVHLARMRSNGYPAYQVSAGEGREFLAPVVRIGPSHPDNPAIGLDLLQQGELQSAMIRSASDAVTQLSQPLILRTGDVGAPVAGPKHVFMVQPLYRAQPVDLTDANAATPDRRDKLSGWMFALFQTSELVASTLGALPANMRLRMFAGTIESTQTLLYDSSLVQPVEWHGQRPLRVANQLDIDGQRWTLVFEGFPRAYANQSIVSGELLAIVVICLLFGLSAVLITVALRNAARLQQLTLALQSSNERYQFLATHDVLTGVANRFLFQDRLNSALLEAKRYEHQFALIYIDLDHFKPVNDTLGHHVGDLLLIEVTRRLKYLLRDSDLLARRGGDEFVVLLTKVGSAVDAENVAEKICAELALPFVLQEHTVLISGSLGVAVYPDNGTDSEQLIHDADQCMYRAKQEGRNRWVSVRKAGTTT